MTKRSKEISEKLGLGDLEKKFGNDGLMEAIGLDLPSDEDYRKFNQELLDGLYEGLESDDYVGKIKKCFEYLKMEVPDSLEKLSEEKLEIFLRLTQSKYLNQANYDWHMEVM